MNPFPFFPPNGGREVESIYETQDSPFWSIREIGPSNKVLIFVR